MRPPVFGGAVAQLGERLNGIEEVGGSSPPSSTKVHNRQNFDLLSCVAILRNFGQ